MHRKIDYLCSLSASHILEKSQKVSLLPDYGGQKFSKPDQSSEQADSLQGVQQQLQQYLSEERTVKNWTYKGLSSYLAHGSRSALSVGDWDEHQGVVNVHTKKGGHWKSVGRKINGREMLLPEECLFLVDQGVFELWKDGLPLSLQEAYGLLVPKLPSLEYYQVYAYLCRLGFTVQRYQRRISDAKDGKWRAPSDCKEPSFEASGMSLDTDDTPTLSHSCVGTLSTNSDDYCQLRKGHMGHLWNEGDVKPLLMPSDAVSTASVLSKLQLIKTATTEDSSTTYAEQGSNYFKLDFNVYQTGVSLKKSDPGPPDCRISVCRYDDPAPTLRDIAGLQKESYPSPVKFAVVGKGSVSFYGGWLVDLPTLISLG